MPWIFLSLMLVNAAYLGWKFVIAEQPQLKSAAVVEDRGQTVQLLEERRLAVKNDESGPSVTDELGQDVGAAMMDGSQVRCFNIGPFNSEAAARGFTKAMTTLGFSTRIENRKIDEKTYWVFIPPFTNREKAEERLRELKSANIDGFIVKEGVFINAISLNHFSRRELAQSFLQEMQAAGLGVEYREISRSGLVPWVFVGQAQAEQDLRKRVEQYLNEHRDLRRENAVCANN